MFTLGAEGNERQALSAGDGETNHSGVNDPCPHALSSALAGPSRALQRGEAPMRYR